MLIHSFSDVLLLLKYIEIMRYEGNKASNDFALLLSILFHTFYPNINLTNKQNIS